MNDLPIRRRFQVLLFIILAGALSVGPAAILSAQQAEDLLTEALTAVSAERMLTDVAQLSSMEFNGRQAGTDDDLRSAAWVRDRFVSAGLSLAAAPEKASGENWLMTTIPAPVIESGSMLKTGLPERTVIRSIGTEYLPILDSPSADLHAPIVFVGYGTTDDYAGIEVADRVVLFLRGKPDHSPKYTTHGEKVRLARSKGALAYLTATGPILNSYEARRGVTGTPSAFYAQMPAADTLPGAWISTQLAEDILAGGDGTQTGRLRELQEQLNKSATARSVRTAHDAFLRWKTIVREGVMANVLAILPGTSSETVVVGAHRDHFGRTAGLLFPGADDNASGTAVMLETGRVLAKTGRPAKRTILFVSFSGEEKDLLGSRWYVAHPAVPLNSTAAMINIDHAGIGNGRLTVGVTGLDKSLAQDPGRSAGLAEKLDLFGFFPGGDHVPFKEAGVPTVTIVSGGVHPHFHQSTDTADTINPEILQTVARYVLALTWRLANEP